MYISKKSQERHYKEENFKKDIINFYDISGRISGMISGMISSMILHQGYLCVLVTETMAVIVKRIALCLGSAIKKFTLPLDTT